ncbi:hypothetical protein QFC19_008042 [Naganishia cerealis]|uniref:Uncharacterized protein n=1 Tax=Naganishia cerealis TaxID=610337 RepID=A0ACC2V574_9TREE|nr:hypothetical protein QFC19_008042 [Naganishia cerealis]
MADSEKIAQFIELTGASAAEANQFLSGSDLSTAVATYFAAQDAESGGIGGDYDEEDDDDDDVIMGNATGSAAPSVPAPQATGGYTLSGAPVPVSTEGISRTSSAAGSTSSGPRVGRIGGPSTTGNKSKSSSSGGARIGTLSSLNASANASDDEDDDGDDPVADARKKVEFYAGGGKSGLAIQNPNDPTKGTSGEDIVNEILARARQGGAAEGEGGGNAPGRGKGKAGGSSKGLFSGAGMTLGSDEVPSVAVPDPSTAHQHASPQPGRAPTGMSGLLAQMFGGGGPGSAGMGLPGGGSILGAGGNPGFAHGEEEEEEDDDEPQIRHLTFWKDGFSIEDGPLMKYDDPANKEILAAIKAGRAPLSILNVKFGQQVELRVAQRQTEAYQPPPKKPMKAFSGSGNRLGSPASQLVDSSTSVPSHQTSHNMPGGFGATGQASADAIVQSGGLRLQVDESKPTTNVQVRLADGTKLVAKLNLDHTVGDIRRFISAAQPGSRSYVIQTTFPNKTLDDESLTIEQAGLKNAVVVQRWT